MITLATWNHTHEPHLSLFGTGIRGRRDLADIGTRWESQEAKGKAVVTFAGAQGDFDGLDQVNLFLPRTLAGLGLGEIAITIDGSESNKVKLIMR